MCDSEEFRNTYAVKGHEPVYINPQDAKKKGIKDGDIVRVFNDRGQLLAGAVLSEHYPTGLFVFKKERGSDLLIMILVLSILMAILIH